MKNIETAVGKNQWPLGGVDPPLQRFWVEDDFMGAVHPRMTPANIQMYSNTLITRTTPGTDRVTLTAASASARVTSPIR